jgi:hypothetical protein
LYLIFEIVRILANTVMKLIKVGNLMLPEARAKIGTWVQTERAAHEAWATLLMQSPRAAQLLHLLIARVGENNAVVASQKTLATLMRVRSINTVKAAIATLREGRWVEVRQIGDRGTVNAYVINDRVAWTGPRDGIRYSLFSATIVVSEEEQPDRHELGSQLPLRALPTLYPGEKQLPTGPGLDPPSEPPLPGMEPDLPAISGLDQIDADDTALSDRLRR